MQHVLKEIIASFKNYKLTGNSGVPVSRPVFSLTGAQVQFLVRELRSCEPCCAKKKKKSLHEFTVT